MKKLIATLITGLFAAGAFANTPAPAAEGAAAPAMAEKTAPKKSHRAKKSHHDKKAAEANAITPAPAQH